MEKFFSKGQSAKLVGKFTNHFAAHLTFSSLTYTIT